MKKQIIGYLTAMINSHERNINRLRMPNVNNVEIEKHENFKNELCDLLDFVEDIRDEKTIISHVYLNNVNESEKLRKRIKELEESCEHMCEIERNLRRKLEVGANV